MEKMDNIDTVDAVPVKPSKNSNLHDRQGAVATIIKTKKRHADLKYYYNPVIELCYVAAIALLIGFFQLARTWELESETMAVSEVTIEVADVPQTEQTKRPPPPPKPSIAVPTDDETVPEDLTIESTHLDLADIPPPPPPPEEDDAHFFIAYDEAPEIIGGFSALLKQLEYPRIARKSGVEGRVIAKVLVSLSGRSERVEILKADPAGMLFEESATRALKKVNWKPAKQRDRAIKTWITVPVTFRLTQ